MAQEGWGTKAQGVAAIIVALIAIAAFFGIKTWQGEREPVGNFASTEGSTAKRLSSPTAGDDDARVAADLQVHPEHVSIDLSKSFAGSDSQGLTGRVSLRIKNTGHSKIAIAWLDARRTASLELNDGTRLRGDSTSHFSGIQNCEDDRPDQCSQGIGTSLAPGEDLLAELEVRTDVPLSGTTRVRSAETATLTASLVIFAAEPGRAYAKSVGLANMALINRTK
jgi:hypothetical protein